ncbi:hypothetical protein HID58_012348 [Brassica napus]|uniref:Uncharacterized protein n=1 Tax=Brassica napus TaxID=3708 RepID=A0ABQ8E0V0_BRANA|nr:hypothetical protein HID58_012348 [Brassica napus]
METSSSGQSYAEDVAQTERVMNAIFPEEGMLLFHRVSLEMAYADNFLANRNRSNPPVREIMELDGDDDEMVDGNQANLATDGVAKGLGLAATVDVVRGKAVGNEANACDNALQQMMKLAICCAVKGVGTSKAGKRATETSSKGSSTDVLQFAGCASDMIG